MLHPDGTLPLHSQTLAQLAQDANNGANRPFPDPYLAQGPPLSVPPAFVHNVGYSSPPDVASHGVAPGGYHVLNNGSFGLYPGLPQQPQQPQHHQHHHHQQQQQHISPPPHALQHPAPTPRHQHQQPEFAPVPPPDDTPVFNNGKLKGLKYIEDPPDLDEWRRTLFHVDNTIALTEKQFQTYFPHIDNVYSHRSSQPHKRTQSISHYYDCRFIGRAPGTRKTTDPDKKKRNRVARERNLCDVKIKITEYFDADELTKETGLPPPVDTPTSQRPFYPHEAMAMQTQVNNWGVPMMQVGPGMPMGAPLRPPAQKFFTLERVNGKGGNGKGDGVAGPHKHTLEKSDKLKRNSVMRWLDKQKSRKTKGNDSSSALATSTINSHSNEEDLKLYGNRSCPFVQQVWIALEFKGIPYQFIEVDPHNKPQSLLDINPDGLVPALRHGSFTMHDSTPLLWYLEDLNLGPALFPSDFATRAKCRLWISHIDQNIIPAFTTLLEAEHSYDIHTMELRAHVEKLVNAADAQGPFFLGKDMSFVDVLIAPFFVRFKRVLGPLRGWWEPGRGSRWAKWAGAIESAVCVKRTVSEERVYLEAYRDRGGGSGVGNQGGGLP